ncbi:MULTISPECIES: RNA 2',3'-cyclic phosphodiesterase [Streptomyces]|uniref:RNA 2',3'-cyclic phosphodiesterase n=1 Tax=Streptomyces griseoaurantiacus TaxID=68213 RepID=UPI002E2CB9CB|nr:RNA 2',3'-cyclic phosphodiesterase [Streptomyces jietaisiensis]WTI27463.1 RNA 2',3'-cyclic phosphodiesterase [Streptomyces jietaisiensis]
MRLFAAVLPPQEAVEELAARATDLRSLPGAEALRWTERSGWHFTLAFYGEVEEETLPGLSARLARAAGRAAPFPLALHGGGRFGDRALWAGASGDVAALRLLAGRAEAAGRRAGVPGAPGDAARSYRPHLTLARSGRRATDLRPYAEALGSFEGRAWEVRALSLVRSRLPASGVAGERPRYETVAHWELSR